VRVISFGAEELADTRFSVSPLTHLIHGVHNGPCSARSGLRERWWATARRHVPEIAVPVVQLINTDLAVLPEFLVPAPASAAGALEPALDEELDQLAASCGAGQFRLPPAGQRGQDLPRLARELADGSPLAISRLVEAFRALFLACMATDWPAIRNQLHGDLTLRTQQMMTGGPGQVLGRLHTSLKLEQDWLIFAGTPVPKDFADADGGLTLMPCAFGSVTLHPQLTRLGRRILVYSANIASDVPQDADALATLVGAGRARTLRALTTSASTSTLARRLAVTAPTASAHANVLRRAGLITTRRDGQQVCHELTPIGAALLAANPQGRQMFKAATERKLRSTVQ
jgi:DNA-binding transcriptional ArsR family regulator